LQVPKIRVLQPSLGIYDQLLRNREASL